MHLPTLDRYFRSDKIVRDTFHIHLDLYRGVLAFIGTGGMDCFRGGLQRLSDGSCTGRPVWHDGYHVVHGELPDRDRLGLRGHFLALLQLQLPVHDLLYFCVEGDKRIVALAAETAVLAKEGVKYPINHYC